MTWVCGAGTGIRLPNLKTHPRQSSSPLPKATFPLQIHCKTSNTVTKPPCYPSVQPISSISRRHVAVVPLVGLSLLLNFSQPAHAKDIPFFGIKKLKKVEEEVVKEAQELVIEGEKGAEKVAEEVKEIAQELESEASLFERPGAAVQAGVVAGAELVGVLVASSVVNSIVGPEPSK
ncbi:hypothetical protein SUGI_1118390 [Cryptomeria japonica]|uniref:uncharacterized protein LOC131051379 n=1 Tax=Cryptomeria japonica TaxID=3369 RepID=UPI00241494CE|nr:uncharacterized protein LOC131051379 [Cryptomeria japonica]GLJ52554.1 hypothetical protein SUGI_1118390 [Cryptomeria japonica]